MLIDLLVFIYVLSPHGLCIIIIFFWGGGIGGREASTDCTTCYLKESTQDALTIIVRFPRNKYLSKHKRML